MASGQTHASCNRALTITWEPDDGVAAYGGVRHVAPDVVNDVAVSRMRVTAPHGSQHFVVAALEGDVEELAHLGQLRARPDQPLREI
jgi:hypothetical protein